ncbi:unnamed protein product [Polarella glacialis]|uniref:Uncharacterized protein n=1 Tax=Polarella glacialis TaxID=89957 RepID=A0A813HMG1_POLGL|nr:unnamed protein product [Polarella glacialis]CAE8675227.1 unnamed protein product [Polarella glacialis]
MVRSMSCCVVDGLQYMAGGTKSRMIPCPASEEALKSFLELSGVDTSQFGIGKAKPLISLLAELREGSCRLEYDRKTKKVCRCVEPVYVQVCYDGKLLVEREHILPNGNQRQRNPFLQRSESRTTQVPWQPHSEASQKSSTCL